MIRLFRGECLFTVVTVAVAVSHDMHDICMLFLQRVFFFWSHCMIGPLHGASGDVRDENIPFKSSIAFIT